MDFSFNLQVLATQFVPFMMAVVFHEYAHGYVANRWGDSTAKDQGRLTLNPLPHIDPIGTVALPVMMMLTGVNVLFGWAKPVPINPSRFRKYRPGLFWVSFAGPGMNFIMGVLSAFVYCGILKFMSPEFYLYKPLQLMAAGSIYINFLLGIFNLIPLPPLDGSKIVQVFLSYEATKKYEELARYSFFIILALLMTGALRVLMYPIKYMAGVTLYIVGALFGLNGV